MTKITFLLSAAIVTLLCSCGNNNKTIQLFNGKDLSNWELVVENNSVPASQVFTAKNSVINITGKPLGYMYTKEKYSDFTLGLEWRWAEGESNSGIFLLIEEPTNPFPNGIECQLKAGNAGDLVLLGGSDLEEFKLTEGEERPKFPIIKKRNESSEKPAGEWNKSEITVKNGVIDVTINGVHQNTGTNKIKTGHIGLQSEGGAIEFRNIILNKL